MVHTGRCRQTRTGDAVSGSTLRGEFSRQADLIAVQATARFD